MILCAECGLRFAKNGDHWRCVEHPDLVMLCGGCYRVREHELRSLEEAKGVIGNHRHYGQYDCN